MTNLAEETTKAKSAEAATPRAAEAEERWLADWFRGQNEKLVERPDQEIATADYFAAQYIDSFGVVLLISEIESRFGIRFSERDFQDRRFSTVAGLANIIRERKGQST